MPAIPARVIATLFAFACFAGTLAVGLYHDNAWWSILLSAFMVMCIAWLIGTCIGALFLKTVDQHIDQYRQDNPIPEDDLLQEPPGPAQAPAG